MTDAPLETRAQLQTAEADRPTTMMADRLRIALIGDIHTYTLTPAPWHLLSKRLLGQLNLWLRRRARFRLSRMDSVVDRVRDILPDALLCAGDLTTTALPAEFERAKRMLKPLTDTIPTYIVPGNHDRYTFTAARRRRFEIQMGALTADRWPWLAQLTPDVHMIGADPTRPRFIFASGELGPTQRQRIEDMLSDCDASLVVMLCHYPIGAPRGVMSEPRTHGLIDKPELLRILRESDRRVLYLHGHVHRPWCWCPPQAPNVIAINAGAPLMTSRDYPHGQGFWQIDAENFADGRNVLRFTHHSRSESGAWRANDVSVPVDPGEATLT